MLIQTGTNRLLHSPKKSPIRHLSLGADHMIGHIYHNDYVCGHRNSSLPKYNSNPSEREVRTHMHMLTFALENEQIRLHQCKWRSRDWRFSIQRLKCHMQSIHKFVPEHAPTHQVLAGDQLVDAITTVYLSLKSIFLFISNILLYILYIFLNAQNWLIFFSPNNSFLARLFQSYERMSFQ